MTDTTSHEAAHGHEELVHLPSRTAWPIILAFGIVLGVAGLGTNIGVTVCGVILTIFGCVGWFRQVLPHESVEMVPVHVVPEPVVMVHRHVEHMAVSEQHRAH